MLKILCMCYFVVFRVNSEFHGCMNTVAGTVIWMFVLLRMPLSQAAQLHSPWTWMRASQNSLFRKLVCLPPHVPRGKQIPVDMLHIYWRDFPWQTHCCKMHFYSQVLSLQIPFFCGLLRPFQWHTASNWVSMCVCVCNIYYIYWCMSIHWNICVYMYTCVCIRDYLCHE